MEVRHPVEGAFLVLPAQRREEAVVRMQSRMPPPPLLDRRRPDRIRTLTPARLVPRLEVGIDEIPRELVHDEQRPEIGELLDRVVERVEVMDDASRDDRIELVVDLAEVALPEAVARRRARIDAEDVVPGGGERGHDAASVAAADLEHARRSRRQVL